MKRSTMVGAAVLFCAGVAHAGVIHPALEDSLVDSRPDAIVSALAYLAVQEDLASINDHMNRERASLAERHEVVVRALQDVAANTQGDLLARLETLKAAGRVADYRSFWISNMVRIDATPAEIRLLADHDDIDIIYPNYEIELIAPVEAAGLGGATGAASGGPEPGVVAVRAPEVWALGITGEGVLVATLDTGVDGNHPALADRWRGVADARYADNPEWAWFDPVTNTTFPAAFGSHGTHTMGSVCGGAPGDQVGVAPGAQWMHAATIDRVSIARTVADSILAFQWMVDPDGDPGTNWDVPASCSNSWGLVTSHGYDPCDDTFWSFIDACEAAGTVVTFSAGNEGGSGLRRPADRASNEWDSMAVASVNANVGGWPISGFSSRGPTNCGPGGSSAIKPDISAPGENVRSSVPGGGYGNLSGTSMASPHINGVVALMRQANPDIGVDEIKQIIYDTAVDLGSSGEDNSYGYGMVDAFEAVQMALSTVGLVFEFPDGRPDVFDPAGGTTIRVIVSSTTGEPEPGTGVLYYSADGDPYTEVAMAEVSDNVYDAVFPGFDCGADVSYYFSAESIKGEIAFSPPTAPDSSYSADVFTSIEVAFEDDFETDTGWTVENIGLADGPWERAVPAGGGDREDPPTDADGSGNCYVTDNADDNSDVDGGPTILTSPAFDATGLIGASISYARWFRSTGGTLDTMLVEISDDDGATWSTLEVVSGGGNWTTRSHTIPNPTTQVRIRFSVADDPNDSVTEAGVDAVMITGLVCEGGGVPGDTDGDGDVDIQDLLNVLDAWGPCGGCPEDLDGDGFVTFQDLLLVIANWTD